MTLLRFPTEPAAWSCISVVVVLSYSAGASLVSGINRFQGSIVGVLSGAVCVVLLAQWVWLPVVAALAVGLSLTVCRLARIGTGFRLGGALAAFFVFVPGNEVWQTAFWRLAATFVGISVALLIVLVVWPARADPAVRKGIAAPIRDSVVVIDAAVAVWSGSPAPEGADVARSNLKKGTNAIATAMAERAHERTGTWEPATYTVLFRALDDAMRCAERLDKVARHDDGDVLLQHTVGPIAAEVAACKSVALDVADRLESGNTNDRDALLAHAQRLKATPDNISAGIERLRREHLTPQAGAEELQRMFAVGLLIEHWAEAVTNLATALADA